MNFFMGWLEHYGYIVLFVTLMIELVAFGIPTELMMSYAGYLVYQGKLGWVLTILISGLGASAGISLAYGIGYKLGTPFFRKYGAKIHMGPDRFKKTSQWFGKYGNKLLIIGYFLPGGRHITGYFSGITKIPFRRFALYSYIGAFIWTALFVSIGRLLGPRWDQFHGAMKQYLIIAGILAVLVIVCVYVYKRNKAWLSSRFIDLIHQSVRTYRSLGRIKFLIIAVFIIFSAFFSLMLGLIQDFLGHEFYQFDQITFYLIHSIFNAGWTTWMRRFAMLGTYRVFVPFIAVSALWIVYKGKNRKLELSFLLIAVIGGELLDEGLRKLFQRVGPNGSAVQFPYTFPSEQTLITLIICGFSAYLLARHFKMAWIHSVFAVGVLFISLLVGLSRIYFEVQYPSDVAAGYVFGGVWLSLNILLLEILRVLQLERHRMSSA